MKTDTFTKHHVYVGLQRSCARDGKLNVQFLGRKRAGHLDGRDVVTAAVTRQHGTTRRILKFQGKPPSASAVFNLIEGWRRARPTMPEDTEDTYFFLVIRQGPGRWAVKLQTPTTGCGGRERRAALRRFGRLMATSDNTYLLDDRPDTIDEWETWATTLTDLYAHVASDSTYTYPQARARFEQLVAERIASTWSADTSTPELRTT